MIALLATLDLHYPLLHISATDAGVVKAWAENV
jgi:hypothetical protein